MKLKRRNPTAPWGIECALLFLAISVFGWGLQAKLSVYQSHPGSSTSAIYMAKMATEKSSAQAVAFVEDKDLSRPTLDLQHFAAVALSLQSNDPRLGFFGQPESGSRALVQYGLPNPNLMRRPPPALS